MSLELADCGPARRPALPRGAVLVLLALALGLHLALGALVFWTSMRDGTVAEGQGGLTVGLGPAGAPPGAQDAVAPSSAETAPPRAQLPVAAARDATPSDTSPAPAPEAAPTAPPAADASTDAPAPAPVPTATTAPRPAPDAAPQPERAQTPRIAESVAPVVARSPAVEPTRPPDAAMVVPTTPGAEAAQDVPADRAVTEGDAALTPAADPPPAPVDRAPDTVVATAPVAGLGVSRRPGKRPEAVEAAGREAAAAAAARQAAEDARRQRRAARAESASESAAQSRTTAAGRQGQGGSSQGSTRGRGDDTRGGGSPGARADFAARVAARLARAKQYPRAAQKRRLEGTGVIWFRMNAAGAVTASRLTRGTGHPMLDQAIAATLRRARLPAIPDSLGRSSMEFSVPISFSLR